MRNEKKCVYVVFCFVFFTRLKNKKYETLVLQLTALTGKTFLLMEDGGRKD